MEIELKPCPFCGGEAKIYATTTRTMGCANIRNSGDIRLILLSITIALTERNEMRDVGIGIINAITPKDAEDELGIMRLAAVIHTVKKLGYAICTEYVNVKDRWGAKRTVASYSLVRQAVSA